MMYQISLWLIMNSGVFQFMQASDHNQFIPVIVCEFILKLGSKSNPHLDNSFPYMDHVYVSYELSNSFTALHTVDVRTSYSSHVHLTVQLNLTVPT